ncbi:MAG: hypothetical protein V7756_03455 [Halopseudomonas sp.]|uniref:hypothetical protein n=1 Tax=Halopseudomonas sp. TaxID=2901191 RepID=UPI0030012126
MLQFAFALVISLLIWWLFMPTGDGFVSLIIIGFLVLPALNWLIGRYWPRSNISFGQEIDLGSHSNHSSDGDSGGGGGE